MLVIEHNLDVIKTADWVIDLGPEGGARGGEIIAAGTPEEVARVAGSYTGQFLRADAGHPARPRRDGRVGAHPLGRGRGVVAQSRSRAHRIRRKPRLKSRPEPT